jgi:catechol 2,3-dioxygenase-like lactoylglutathione lyase family enzyme
MSSLSNEPVVDLQALAVPPGFHEQILLRVEHAQLRAPDPEALASWYVGVLGLVERERNGGIIYLGCGGEDRHHLSITTGDAGLDHVALLVDDEPQLSVIDAHFAAHGADHERRSDPCPGVRAAVRTTLPTGHAVDIVVRDQRQGYLIATEWNAAAAMAPTELNHVSFATTDPARLYRHLAEVLGMRTSDIAAAPDGFLLAAFMRVGENHHDLALLPGARDAMHHLAFSIADVGELVAFADRLTRHGSRPEVGIGRHGPGNNIYLYVRDPAGHRVELSTQLARVTDRDAPTRIWTGAPTESFNLWAEMMPPMEFYTEVT